jgi:hypothetical protein
MKRGSEIQINRTASSFENMLPIYRYVPSAGSCSIRSPWPMATSLEKCRAGTVQVPSGEIEHCLFFELGLNLLHWLT